MKVVIISRNASASPGQLTISVILSVFFWCRWVGPARGFYPSKTDLISSVPSSSSCDIAILMFMRIVARQSSSPTLKGLSKALLYTRRCRCMSAILGGIANRG